MVNYIPGGAFLLLGFLIIFSSYVRQVTNFRNRNNENGQWSSPVPFMGPVLVVVGYWLLPIAFSRWIFLVIVLDPDTMVVLLSIPYLIIKGLRQ